MKNFQLLLPAILLGFSLQTHAASLSQSAQQAKVAEAQHDATRTETVSAQLAKLAAQKSALQKEQSLLQKNIDSLSKTFSENESKLAAAEEKLRLETGALGEVFGVIRQHAKEFQTQLQVSSSQAEDSTALGLVDEVVDARKLPSLTQLRGYWQAMIGEIESNQRISSLEAQVVSANGSQALAPVARLGDYGLVGEQGYLEWRNKAGAAFAYPLQPENSPNLEQVIAFTDGGTHNIVIDPSHGTLLSQLADEPTLVDRIKAGGVIGNIIIALLVIGLLIALIRGAILFAVKQKVNRQLKHPQNIGNNPLGRVLNVYATDPHRSVEALELRLIEAVMDEHTKLERGLSMLKLLAAIAPMLGLLGTVTGMIETFQVITQYGNGDPKVMAGGISMALVTTVLGLIAAMPLLLAHNVLSSMAENISAIIEKQGVGLVAEQAEIAQSKTTNLELSDA